MDEVFCLSSYYNIRNVWSDILLMQSGGTERE